MPKTQLQCASSAMSGALQQAHILPKSATPSAATGGAVTATSLSHAGTKRSTTLNSSDHIVPGSYDSCGASNVASTQHTGNAEVAVQSNRLVPTFGLLKRKPHVAPAASVTQQPPAKKPVHMLNPPTFHSPAHTPARRQPQAPTAPHQRASTATTHTSLPTRDQLQRTPTPSQRPGSTSQDCLSAADGRAATGSKSGGTSSTQSKGGTGPFQQVPASVMDGMEDNDAFYPSTQSKRVQYDIRNTTECTQ